MTDVLLHPDASPGPGSGPGPKQPSPVSTAPASAIFSPVAPHPTVSTDPEHLNTDDAPDQEDDGVIACICAYRDDDGNTIQCDKCLRWQHILCYYPPPAQTPDEASTHYCIDCQPRPSMRPIDARKATERQRQAMHDKGLLPAKPHPAKSHKKKVRDSPTITTQTNGVPTSTDRHGHLVNAHSKSASPRDLLPPPAKRPKIAHKASNPTNNGVAPHSRKRASTVTIPRSSSQSPEHNGVGKIMPFYSTSFLRLFNADPPQIETATNLMNNISITNSLSEWLSDSKAVEKATRGLTPSDIFQRWDGRIEDIPGSPQVSVRWVEDPHNTIDGLVPRWAQLTVEDQLAPRAFIGELRGRVGHVDHYVDDPESRWHSLRHPLPFVFFHPQLPVYIDARQEGSIFRFVRRSCDPNAKLQTIITEGTEYHFCFMAIKDVMPGDEITVAWQVPEIISEMIATSFDQTNNVQPDVREHISRWASKVLANCGPCACNGRNNCLMAHYDRRGQPQQRLKKPKKARVSQIETNLGSARSRSTSETHKKEPLDDATLSAVVGRHQSTTPATDSRDMTPNAYDASLDAAGNGLPEMSERERKKLIREEEMFRRQEKETGKQRKKRPSGGSNLSTPVSATPVRASASRASLDLLMDRPSNRKSLSKHVDSTFDPAAPRSTTGKHDNDQSMRSPRCKSSTVLSPRPVYVDAAIQCDMDQLERPRLPQRRYVSVTQKLLKRCTLSNAKRKSLALEQKSVVEDAMDVDSAPASPEVLSDVTKTKKEPSPDDTQLTPLPLTTVNGAPLDTDQDMADADAIPHGVTEPTDPPNHHHVPASASDVLPDRDDGVGSLQQPLAESAVPLITADHHEPRQSDPTHTTGKSQADTDVEMAPPPVPNHRLDDETPSNHDRNAEKSAATHSPPLLEATTLPKSSFLTAFSPSVTAAVAPSPVRKKLSLSDYTKRSKATRESTGDSTSGGTSTLTPTRIDAGPETSAIDARIVSPDPVMEQEPTDETSLVSKGKKSDVQEEARAPIMTNGHDVSEVDSMDQKADSQAAPTAPMMPKIESTRV